ncbi:hypothetical protein [Corynebacterium tapiri]|uniref:Uncharacterized protein n=1 Tax=Corynebacterium tapiri TaxID=1448266 RepID=A0A5C4U6L6_9CORY|nr:hypothetical protein [Corynebacterium tapiri]TNL99384.1 hypothetical protein FHE74_03240 [Corynebacterium tapiri]
MSLDGVDRTRVGLATASAVGLVGLLVFASLNSEPPAQVGSNGDVLGPEGGQTLSAYRDEANQTLAEAPQDQPAYSMVTFSSTLTPQEVGEITSELRRVNAVVSQANAPRPIPEPVEGATRAEVFQQYTDGLDAVIAYDTPEALKPLLDDPRVLAVEVLPPDAVWGAFGVRPPRA